MPCINEQREAQEKTKERKEEKEKERERETERKIKLGAKREIWSVMHDYDAVLIDDRKSVVFRQWRIGLFNLVLTSFIRTEPYIIKECLNALTTERK